MTDLETSEKLRLAIGELMLAPGTGSAVARQLTDARRAARDQSIVIDLHARRAARDAQILLTTGATRRPDPGAEEATPPALRVRP